MFLFDSNFASTYTNVEQELERIMQRAEAEIVFQKKWDDRRLAYEIKKQKRGCYVLVFFNGDPEKIGRIERDCKLSDNVLRVMILDAEGLSKEYMESLPIPATTEHRPDREFDGDARRRPAESRPSSSATATVEAPAATATSEKAEASEAASTSESTEASETTATVEADDSAKDTGSDETSE